jgi:hypothetical protein
VIRITKDPFPAVFGFAAIQRIIFFFHHMTSLLGIRTS